MPWVTPVTRGVPDRPSRIELRRRLQLPERPDDAERRRSRVPASRMAFSIATVRAQSSGVRPFLSRMSTSAPQAVNWAQLTGGTPDASVTPSEITSIYWFFPWTDTTAPYALDFTIDDLKFIK